MKILTYLIVNKSYISMSYSVTPLLTSFFYYLICNLFEPLPSHAEGAYIIGRKVNQNEFLNDLIGYISNGLNFYFRFNFPFFNFHVFNSGFLATHNKFSKTIELDMIKVKLFIRPNFIIYLI